MTLKTKWKNLGGSFRMADGRQIRRNEVFEATEGEISPAFRDTVKPLDSLPPEPTHSLKHRSHKPGEHLDYDLELSRLFTSSGLLNEKGRSYISPLVWQTATLAGLRGVLTELEGAAERTADLLAKIDQEFARLQVSARRKGKPEPETMPPDLLAEKLRAEARADVTAEEIEKIRGLVATKEAPEKAAEEAQVLRNGPCGSSKGDPVRMIDGQPVVADWKGTLRISCPKSPYHKMAVADYRTLIVKPFLEFQSRPLTQEELALAPQDRKPRWGGWADLPPRPGGY